MARKVWLTITGIQKGFDQEEPVTLVTEGSYIHKNGVHYIFYSERTEEGGIYPRNINHNNQVTTKRHTCMIYGR